MDAIVAVWAIATNRLLRKPCDLDLARQITPTFGILRDHSPGVELQFPARGTGLRETRVCAVLARRACTTGGKAWKYTSAEIRRDSARAASLSKGSRSLKNTSCKPIKPRPTGRQRKFDDRAPAMG